MGIIGFIASLIMIGAILLDAFEAVLLPRRVSHKYRFLRFFYRNSWSAWRALVANIRVTHRRETMLSLFGPLALLVLYVFWASGLVIAFGLLHWSIKTPLHPAAAADGIGPYMYFSGTTFFTLGYGDLTPTGALGRFLAVIESGLGFGFLAIIIGYHPVLTQTFSRREIVISLLDARGGSPPSASEILVRCGAKYHENLQSDFREWEVWAAELLENSLSFPMLAYYRSQHDNQSWLAALTVMLDTCALIISGTERERQLQSRLTFAIARHAAVDLMLIFKINPVEPQVDRLDQSRIEELNKVLSAAGIPLIDHPKSQLRLNELRKMYEPFVNGLAQYFLLQLPDFHRRQTKADNWQTSAWMQPTPGILDLPQLEPGDHFQ